MKMAEYWIQDCSAATENILLRVTDLGLGAVWCGIHPQKKAEEPEAREQYEEKRVHYIK